MNIFLILLIGISLSMDTFSLSLSLGTFNIDKKKSILFSCVVATFHFFMPLLGVILGNSINKFLIIDPDKLMFIIFLFLSIEMFIDLLSKEEKQYDLTFFNMLIYAFSVSIDSLTIGIGLLNIISSAVFGALIFAFTSFIFTFIGLFIGRYTYEKLGKISKIMGLIIILLLAILHLLK